MTNDIDQFNAQVANNIRRLSESQELKSLGMDFVRRSGELNYSYNFSWMGIPIIQFPQDIVAMQELIWKMQPDVIVETGVARGGSILFYSSMFEMMGREGKVIGVDIDIRAHNREAIENHPMAKRVTLIEGSSIAPETLSQVEAVLDGAKNILVCLDSMHSHDHVLEELRLYSRFISPGGYLVVFDTCIEFMPEDYYPDRPWGVGNNAFTAVEAFLAENSDFERDSSIDGKLLITVAPGGYLRRKA